MQTCVILPCFLASTALADMRAHGGPIVIIPTVEGEAALFSGTSERHEVRRPGYSHKRPGRRASSNRKIPLLSVAQLVAQLAEGFAL